VVAARNSSGRHRCQPCMQVQPAKAEPRHALGPTAIGGGHSARITAPCSSAEWLQTRRHEASTTWTTIHNTANHHSHLPLVQEITCTTAINND
jgi:hypothetical protein